MTVHNNQLSRWIFRGVIGLGVMLVTLGAGLLLSDDDRVDSSSLTEPITTGDLPEQTTNGQVSEALQNIDGVADYPSVVWDEILPPSDVTPLARRALEYFGSAAMGPAYADVTIVEIGSYGCVACRKVHQNGMIQNLMGQYPDQVRYIFISWPIIINNIDMMATEAVLCAMDQSQEYFWTFHNILLDLTNEQYGRHSTYAHYSNIAESIDGVDVVQFNTCMIDGDHHKFVNELVQVGFDLNLRGTPSFFINGELTSAYSLEAKVTEHLEPELPDTLIQPSETP